MRRIVATGASDVGRVRKGNEDALLLRDSVFAVADGMGGHLAGEVASSAALEPIKQLDGQVFGDPQAAGTALRDAVVAANATVSKMAEDNPSYRGMGTTLTAVMLEGRRMHVAHVGDSRAYLLRDGQFSQLTDDHTLVQHLIDEGQITPEEAATHPQRSIITRAIGVSPEVEVDAMSLDLDPGDQVLLCSDGLTGVVSDDDIAGILESEANPDTAIQRLIEHANAAGGPDNITALLLRYEDPNAPSRPRARAADTDEPRTIAISSRDEHDSGDWAGRLGAYGSMRTASPTDRPGDEQPSPQAGRILGRAVAIVIGILIIGGLVFGGGRFLLSRSYFVGLDDTEVAIYQGVDASLGPFNLARVVERTDLLLDDIPVWYHPALEAGRTAADLTDARRIVSTIPLRDEDADDSPTDGADQDTNDGGDQDTNDGDRA